MNRQKTGELTKDNRKLERQILDQLIDKKLQLQLAREKKIIVPKEQIKAAIEDLMQQNGLDNLAQFEQILTQQGLSLEQIKQQIEEKIKITKLISTEVRSKILVTQAEIKAYYEEHLEDYKKLEELRARHIFIPVPEGASPKVVAAARKKAEEILAQLEQGADFEQLARKYASASSGNTWGDLGYFTRGQLMPELEAVVWNLQPGQAGLVHTPFGYHIVQVTERKPHTLENDPKIREEIKQIIFRNKLDEQLKEWQKELRQRASIKIML